MVGIEICDSNYRNFFPAILCAKMSRVNKALRRNQLDSFDIATNNVVKQRRTRNNFLLKKSLFFCFEVSFIYLVNSVDAFVLHLIVRCVSKLQTQGCVLVLPLALFQAKICNRIET